MVVKVFFKLKVISVVQLFMVHPTVCFFVLFSDLVREVLFATYKKTRFRVKKLLHGLYKCILSFYGQSDLKFNTRQFLVYFRA